MKIKYEDLLNEVINIIEKNKIMILATSSNNRVTARSMSIVNDGLTIFFQASIDSTKYKQIEENPNVALCVSNMQVEGKAIIKKHPLDNENFFFQNAYKKYHKGSFDLYSSLEQEKVIEVIPSLITLWKYEGSKNPYRDLLYIEEKKCKREYFFEN